MRRAYAARMPSAILYVDLRSAFHSLVRELVLGAGLGGPTDLRALQKTLDQEGFEDEIIDKITQTHGILPDGILKALMRELHGFTWSTIQGKGVRTARGSRPGSPLADALFHCLMSPIVKQIEEQIATRERHVMPCSVRLFRWCGPTTWRCLCWQPRMLRWRMRSGKPL